LFMVCPFCKEQIADGSIKCHHCREFIVAPKRETDKTSYSRLQFFADLMKAVSWPLFIFVIVLTFRGEISDLTKRAKSFEIAGAKSEFADYASALGYLQNKVGQLAAEPDPNQRQELRREIQSTTEKLKGLHPLALAFLIEIGRGVRRDDAWGQFREQLFELKQRGFITVTPDASTPAEITKDTFANLTEAGNQFLDAIGYTNRMTTPGSPTRPK